MSQYFDGVSWPLPGDRGLAGTELERWAEILETTRGVEGEDEDLAIARGLAADSSGGAMLACLLGSSPFLGQCLEAEPGYAGRLWRLGPRACVNEVLAELRDLPSDVPEATLAPILRIARRRVALVTAIADIAGLWEADEVTRTLSELADQTCSDGPQVATFQAARTGHTYACRPGRPGERFRFAGLRAWQAWRL